MANVMDEGVEEMEFGSFNGPIETEAFVSGIFRYKNQRYAVFENFGT